LRLLSRATHLLFLPALLASAAETPDLWGVKGQVPLNLEALFDNDAIADAQDRGDGNFDCPDHAADVPGSTFPAENLPATGSKFSFGDVNFLFPSKERGDLNNVACNGQRIELPPGRYKALHLVGTSENGSFRDTLALAYKEGPAETELALTDWCKAAEHGERSAFEAPCRYTYSSDQRRVVREDVKPHLWLQKIALDPKKTLEAVSLPYSRRMHLFAATLEAADWTEEQASYASATAEHYASLGRRGVTTGDELRRKLEALAKQLDRLAASGPLARQFGWLRTQAAYWEDRVGGFSFVLSTNQASRALQGLNADLRALQAGNDPFPAKRGCFLRSYRSEVDGSLQSYSLAVPGDYKGDKPFPLLVSLHGHGWYRPFQGHPQRVINGLIAVAPQGRGSIDYMLTAERDVLAAIEDVARDYRIDPNRIYLEGHSMGGTGSWQIGVHHPDLFAAIAPVCGNADRRAWEAWAPKNVRSRYTMPPRFAELRDHVLDTVDPVTYAGNLLNLPALAAHGAQDDVVPVGNSRNMAEALKQLGCPAQYEEFEFVRHWGFPNSFYDKRWSWMTSQQRVAAPQRVRYRTASLRHDGAYWVRIERFAEPLKLAEVDARHLVAQTPAAGDPGRFEIATSNVAAFALDLVRSPAFRRSSDQGPPKGGTTNEPPKGGTTNAAVKIDGQELRAEGASPTFVRSSRGRWRAEPLPKGLAKKKGLEGPVADAFLDSFVLVRGTTSPDEWEREVIRREAEARARDWERLYNCRPRVRDDTAITDDDIKSHHLILYGGPAANAITARVAPKLPITIDRDRIRVGGKSFQGADVGVKLCYPNPLNPERYVVVFAALSPDALGQINNRFGNWFGWGPYDNYDWFDYGVFDSRTLSPESFLCVGFFDQAWELDDRCQFLGDEAARQARLPQRVPKLRRLPDPAPAELFLGDLTPALVDQHKGVVGFDRSHEGNPLTIGGKTFERGLGVRPPSKVEYPLDGKYAFFRATVGLDLEDDLQVTPARDRGERVQFVVYGDGKRLYSSEWLKWNSKPAQVAVEIKGVKTLCLEADCSASRWLVGSADWAEARVTAR